MKGQPTTKASEYNPRVTAGMDKVAAAYNYPELTRMGKDITPEEVGRSAQRKRAAQEQAQRAKKLKDNFEAERGFIKDIERYRLEAIKSGLKDDVEIQKYIYAAIAADRRYDGY